MLVLSRKLDESIIIGDNIVVTVVNIDRNQIRLGIQAPRDIPVHREEIAGTPKPEEASKDADQHRQLRLGGNVRRGKRTPKS